MTTKASGRDLTHLGWFPYELLDEDLRSRPTRLFLPGPHASGCDARIQG